jgi:oligoendopeptidase F
VLLFPAIALGDAFQHWVYTHPGHTRDERAHAWVELSERFGALVDWSGYEQERAHQWHHTLHFFVTPFYYIEYGIAQTGALQVWMHSLQNYHEAVDRYRSALALGGSRPLPELFAAAGARFQFDYKILQPLTAAIEEQFESAPA